PLQIVADVDRALRRSHMRRVDGVDDLEAVARSDQVADASRLLVSRQRLDRGCRRLGEGRGRERDAADQRDPFHGALLSGTGVKAAPVSRYRTGAFVPACVGTTPPQ